VSVGLTYSVVVSIRKLADDPTLTALVISSRIEVYKKEELSQRTLLSSSADLVKIVDGWFIKEAFFYGVKVRLMLKEFVKR
jgi:hypothetical protein